MDSSIERLERRLMRLLDRKTALDTEDAMQLADMWRDVVRLSDGVSKSLSDFYIVVTS